MIVVDTAVWIDHFHGSEPTLAALLETQSAGVHPFVIGELAMGSLRDRGKTLRILTRLPQLEPIKFETFLAVLDGHDLFSRGLSFVDANILASLLARKSHALWTRDKRLRAVAIELGIEAFDG